MQNFKYPFFILLLTGFIGCGNPSIVIDADSDEYKNITVIGVEGTEDYRIEFKKMPFSGVITDHYEDQRLKSRAEHKDGKLDGVTESYYENGQLEERT